jgi:hypothetical protein
MKFPKAFLIFLSTLLMVGSVPAFAQGPEGPRPKREREQRWHDMEGQRRQDMRQRFGRLHRMDASERKETLNRAQLLREIMADVYRKMDDTTRARVDALQPGERANLLGKLALEEARSRSREARLILGSNGASSPEGSPQAGASREDRRAMHEAFMLKARKRLAEYVEKNGLPKGITQEQWDEFNGLEGRRFGHRLHQLADQFPELVEVIGPPPGRPKVDGERWELHEAMRLPPREHVKLVGPEGEDTRKKEMEIRRKRVMSVLESRKSMSEEQLHEVRALTDHEFMRWMHKRLGPPRGGGGEPGRGPGMGPPREGPPGMGRPEGPRGERVSPHPGPQPVTPPESKPN